MTTRINKSNIVQVWMQVWWKCNSNQKLQNDKCLLKCKNSKEHCVCKNVYFWNPATSSCKNGKYARNIIGDSVVICDEIIDMTKPIPTKSTSIKNVSTKYMSIKIFLTKRASTNFYMLLAFSFVTTGILIAVSVYCYLV